MQISNLPKPSKDWFGDVSPALPAVRWQIREDVAVAPHGGLSPERVR